MTDTPILDRTLANDGFWPDVEIRAINEGFRLAPDGREGMILEVLKAAIIDANDALTDAKAQAQADGFATLAAYADSVPDRMVGGDPEVFVLYRAAVGNLAKAKQVKRRQDVQRKPVTDSEALGADNTETYWLDESQGAIARIANRLAPDIGGSTVHGAHVASLGPKRRDCQHRTGDSPW